VCWLPSLSFLELSRNSSVMSSTSGESALCLLASGCWEDPLAGVDSSLSLFVPLSSCAGVCKIGAVGGSVCGGGVCSVGAASPVCGRTVCPCCLLLLVALFAAHLKGQAFLSLFPLLHPLSFAFVCLVLL
jgi:hypothetical protein